MDPAGRTAAQLTEEIRRRIVMMEWEMQDMTE